MKSTVRTGEEAPQHSGLQLDAVCAGAKVSVGIDGAKGTIGLPFSTNGDTSMVPVANIGFPVF
jgi:hypothetical protein